VRFVVGDGVGVLAVAKWEGVNLSASSMVDSVASPSPASCFIFRKCEKQVQRKTACTFVASLAIPLPASSNKFLGVLVFCFLDGAPSLLSSESLSSFRGESGVAVVPAPRFLLRVVVLLLRSSVASADSSSTEDSRLSVFEAQDWSRYSSSLSKSSPPIVSTFNINCYLLLSCVQTIFT